MARGGSGGSIAAGVILVAVLAVAALRSCGDESDADAPPRTPTPAPAPAPPGPSRAKRVDPPKAAVAVAAEPDPSKPTCRLRVRALGGDPPQPVAGAAIGVFAGRWWNGDADGHGAVAFDGVTAGGMTVTASAPGWARGHVELTTADGEDATVVVRLSRGAALEFTVTDAATGAPIEKSWIDLDARLTGGGDGVMTGPDGRATAWMEPSRSFVVNAEHDGYIDATVAARTGRVGDPPAAVAIRLLRAATLRGVVRDPSGAPVEGATVVLTEECDDPETGDAYHPESGTGKDGGYTVDDLVPGRAYSCRADRESFARSEAVRVVIDPARRDATCNLVLRSLVRVTVTISAADHQPVGSAMIRVGAFVWNGDPSSNRFPSEPGPLTVVVRAEGFAPAWRTVDVRGPEVVEVPVGLDRGATIRGVVVDTDGKPVEGALVAASPLDASSCPEGTGDTESSVSAEDGAFAVELLRPVPYDLEAGHPDFETARQRVVAPSDDVRIVLTRRARLSFRLVWDDESAGHRPDGQLLIWGRRFDGQTFAAVHYCSDGDAVDVGWPRDATPQLQIALEGYETVSAIAVVPPGGSVELGDVHMRRATRRRVEGVVRLADGSPAAGAHLRLEQPGSPSDASNTDADELGRFAFDAALTGPGTMTVSHLRAPRTDFAVAAGPATKLELDLPLGGLLRVQTTDARGYPVAYASVTVRDPRGRSSDDDPHRTDERGGAEWVVAPGVWTVETKAGTTTVDVRAGEIAIVTAVVR